jgi:cytoskeleton protein RodZ
MIYGAYYVISSTSSMLSQPVTPAPPPQLSPKAVAHIESNATVPAPASPITGTLPGTLPTPNSQAPGTAPAAGAAPSPAPEASLPPGQAYGEQNRNARVVLRVHQATRILVQGPDGVPYINRIMNPGDTYQVPNIVGGTLTTTNAGAVEVDLDGQSMGHAGKGAGVVEAISLDPQSIVDRSSGGGTGR